MQASQEPEYDNMTLWHWLFVVAGIASFFSALISSYGNLGVFILCVGPFISSRIFTGRKRQFAICFLLGGMFLFASLFVAMIFSGITSGQ